MTRQILSFTTNNLYDLSKTGIYYIVNKTNNKFYIGSTRRVGKGPADSGFYKRWAIHISDLSKNKHRNQHLQNAWNKYGKENFDFRIVEFVEPEYCIEIEQTYLDNCIWDLTYNINKNAAEAPVRELTQEHKDNISKAILGRSEKSFYLVNPEGIVFEGVNLRRFCKEENLSVKNLNRIIKGHRSHWCGWTTSLENHQKYKHSYEMRGIRLESNGSWRVSVYKEGAKIFHELEEAKMYRDKLANKGYEWRVKFKNY